METTYKVEEVDGKSYRLTETRAGQPPVGLPFTHLAQLDTYLRSKLPESEIQKLFVKDGIIAGWDHK